MGRLMRGKVIYGTTLIGLFLFLFFYFWIPKHHIERIHHHRIKQVDAKSDLTGFKTHLPIISIDTKQQVIPLVTKEGGKYVKARDNILMLISNYGILQVDHIIYQKSRELGQKG